MLAHFTGQRKRFHLLRQLHLFLDRQRRKVAHRVVEAARELDPVAEFDLEIDYELNRGVTSEDLPPGTITEVLIPALCSCLRKRTASVPALLKLTIPHFSFPWS